VFFAFAVVLTFGTFYYENKPHDEFAQNLHAFSAFDFGKENEISHNGIIRFGSSVKPDVSTKKAEDNEYLFDVKDGEIWGDFSYSDAKVNFIAGNVVVIPYSASFNLFYDGEKFSLAVYKGDVYLGFLDKGISLGKYEDSYSDVFMNRFLVPELSRVDFSTKRIDGNFKSLLPSKIEKELKYRAISTSPKDANYSKNYTEWVKQNLKDDRRKKSSLNGDLKSSLISDGIYNDSGVLNTLVAGTRNILTFIPAKTAENNFNKTFGYLNDAMLFAAKGDKTESGVALNEFNNSVSSLGDLSTNQKYKDLMGDYFANLFIVRDESDFNNILNILVEEHMKNNSDIVSLMDILWVNVYESLNINQSSALDSLSYYYSKLFASLNKITDETFLRKYLVYQNQLSANLLLKFPVFHKDIYFENKENLEKKFLESLDKGQLNDEWMLSFIKDKVNVLVKLQKYFFEGKVEINEARKIVSRLKESMQDLISKSSSNLAVLDIFKNNLKDISSFWGFLNTPEYYASNSYGADYSERYKIYLKESKEIWNFLDVEGQDSSSAGSKSDKDIDRIMQKIEASIKSNPDVTNYEIGDITDANQVKVAIKLIVNGYPVEAVYDVNRGILNDVTVYGEVITDTGVSVKGLTSLINKKFAKFADTTNNSSGDEISAQETNAQIILKRFLADKMKAAGINVSVDNIKIKDSENGVVRVEDALVDGFDKIKVTFDYSVDEEKAVKVYLIDGADVTELDGKYTFEQIKTEVEKISSF
jgi:hypothetical protein